MQTKFTIYKNYIDNLKKSKAEYKHLKEYLNSTINTIKKESNFYSTKAQTFLDSYLEYTKNIDKLKDKIMLIKSIQNFFGYCFEQKKINSNEYKNIISKFDIQRNMNVIELDMVNKIQYFFHSPFSSFLI